MASVLPMEDEEEVEYEDEEEYNLIHPDSPRQSKELNEEEQAKQMKFLLKQMRINRRDEFFESLFSYEYIKDTTAWFLDTASCNISLTVRFSFIQSVVVSNIKTNFLLFYVV